MATPAKSFIEDFKSLSPDKWANWGGAQVVAQDGQFKSTTTLTANYYGMDSNERFDLTGSDVSIEIVSVGNQALTSFEVIPMQLFLDANNALFWLITGNTLAAYHKVATTNTQVGSGVTFNGTTHKYLRIRESGGTTFWEYSADRDTWTTLASESNAIAVTLLGVTLMCGCWAVEASATTAIYKDLNTLGKASVANQRPTIRTGDGMSISEP